MRVLILSCNTGEGHNSCAKAIKEVFDTHNVPCDIEDVLRFVSPSFSKFIAWGHSTMYRYIPTLFRHGYVYFENHPESFEEGAWVRRILSKASEPLYHYIKNNQYDTVICVHVLSSLVLTDILEKYPLSIASAFVATDYTCSPQRTEQQSGLLLHSR